MMITVFTNNITTSISRLVICTGLIGSSSVISVLCHYNTKNYKCLTTKPCKVIMSVLQSALVDEVEGTREAHHHVSALMAVIVLS